MASLPHGALSVRETHNLIHEALFGMPMSCSNSVQLSQDDEATFFASLREEWMPRFIVSSILGIGLKEGWITAHVLGEDQKPKRIPSEDWTPGTTECLSPYPTGRRFPPATRLGTLPVPSIVFNELELARTFGSVSVWTRGDSQERPTANRAGPPSPQRRRRGAPEKFPWAEATQALREKLAAQGAPFAGHPDADWQSDSDAVELVSEWFSERGLKEPGATQTRKVVKRIIEEFRKEGFH